MKLIFVYNADSGLLNNWLDIAHKTIRPSTYECALCTLTHGSFKEKRAWKSFRKSSDHELEFYHRDEFEKAFKSKWLPAYEYPLVLTTRQAQLEVLISSQRMLEFASLEELIAELKRLSLA